MRTVFMAQLAKDRRNPLLILLFIGLSVIATLMFSGGFHNPITIAIYSEEVNAKEIEDKWGKLLNTPDSSFKYKVVARELAREQILEGRSQVAVKLMDQDYRLIAVSDAPMIQQVDQHVRKVMMQEMQILGLGGTQETEQMAELRNTVHEFMENPPFQMLKQGTDGKEFSDYNMGLQLMFAFTFLASMFTVGFKVNGVTSDKVSGIWDRLILSPVRKSGMYLGYLLYSFCITFVQIMVVLLIFKYVLKYDLGNQFGLVIGIVAVFTFSIVSLAMLVTGFVSKPEQFYSIYPSVIPLIPLISGAYMMPGTMDLPVLNFVADLFPLSHAMDALMDVVLYDAGLSDIALSLSLMLLIGIVYMGVGINMVERRSRS